MKSRPGEHPAPASQPAGEKRPYTTPILTAHGTVEKITQALATGSKDGLSGSSLL